MEAFFWFDNSSERWFNPTQAKGGLEWATRHNSSERWKATRARVGVPHVSRFLRDVGDNARDGLANDTVHNRIWQRRFYDFYVWTDRKRIEKLRYMHRNPVKRGLVAEPDQWTWSSFRAYLHGEPGPARVKDWEVLDKIDFSRASA